MPELDIIAATFWAPASSAAIIVETALRQLQWRFGVLDEAAQAHIRALPLAQVEELSDVLLDFKALADLTAWLQQHPLAGKPVVV